MVGKSSGWREKWRAFASWLMTTEAWQIFIVRAFPPGENRWRTRVASGMSLLFGPFLICVGIDSWIAHISQPVLDLSQMTQRNGVLTRVYHRGRSLNQSGFEIRTEGGKTYWYTDTLSFTYDKMRSQIGKPITVWSQPGFRPLMFWGAFYETPMQIQVGVWLIEDYAQIRPNREKYASYAHKLNLTLICSGLFLVLRVGWKHRRPMPTKS